MAFLHRVLVTWFLGLVFLILVVIRLEQRTNWNWFIVFIPLWIFDVVVLTYSVFYIVSRLRNDPREICSVYVRRKVYVLGTVVLKMATQILLCLKLSAWNMPLYYIFIPVWCVLGIGLTRIILILGDFTLASCLGKLHLNCLQNLLSNPSASHGQQMQAPFSSTSGSIS